MGEEFEYFINLVDSAGAIEVDKLRAELISKHVDFWGPDNFWEWKESADNYKQFAHFIVLAIRCLDGTEDESLPIALISNLHLVVPWSYENIAEFCTLLMEEYIQKKVARSERLLAYIEEVFLTHPDFSEEKEQILDDFQHYRIMHSSLKFRSLTDEVT